MNVNEIHCLWAHVHTQGYFFSSHALYEGSPTLYAVLVFSVFWEGRWIHKSAEQKIGRVLQCPSCRGKNINPSWQTTMKARLRVTSWESEDLRGWISESGRTDVPLGLQKCEIILWLGVRTKYIQTKFKEWILKFSSWWKYCLYMHIFKELLQCF